MSVNQVKIIQAIELVKEVMEDKATAAGHLRLATTALIHLEAGLQLTK